MCLKLNSQCYYMHPGQYPLWRSHRMASERKHVKVRGPAWNISEHFKPFTPCQTPLTHGSYLVTCLAPEQRQTVLAAWNCSPMGTRWKRPSHASSWHFIPQNCKSGGVGNHDCSSSFYVVGWEPDLSSHSFLDHRRLVDFESWRFLEDGCLAVCCFGNAKPLVSQFHHNHTSYLTCLFGKLIG